MTAEQPTLAVLITGAGSGIGEACARRLAGRGWRVFAGVLDDAQRAHVERSALANTTPLVLDITDAAAIADAAQQISAEVGPRGLQGLVNNAGIGVMGPLEYLPIPLLRRQLEVNVIGHVAMTQACLPMLRAATGRIVNIASLAGRVSMPLLGPYSASKFAMEAVSDALRQELFEWGLHVSCIEPSLIDTPIWGSSQQSIDAVQAAMPLAGRAHYQALFQNLDRSTALQSRASPPDVVARAVEHALTARRPKTRYVVGAMRWQFLLLSKLPDRWRDWLARKAFG